MDSEHKKALETLLKRVVTGHLESKPVTEKISGGFSKFRAEEHERDLDAWDSTIRHQVEKCFHNMTSIRAELSAIGNENKEATSDVPRHRSHRVRHCLRATKKPSSK